MKTRLKNCRLIYLFLFLLTLNTSLVAEKSTNYHAIIIAIDDYNGEQWPSTNNAVEGANTLKSVLKNKYSFSDITTIYNESATRINVISTIENKINQLAEDDNLIIFYSGNTKKIHTETYWIPTEAKSEKIYELISTIEIKNIISQAKSNHILLLVDGLFNDTVINSFKSTIKSDNSAVYYKQMNTLLSRQILISGRAKKSTATEEKSPNFIKAIVQLLEKNEKSEVTISELFQQFFNLGITTYQEKMKFGFLQNTGHEGGQFIFRLQEGEAIQLCDSPVYFEEGEVVEFDEKGGVLHAKTDFKNVKYEWSFNSQLLDHEGANLEVKKSGMYGVTIIMEDGDCSNAAISEVTVVMPVVAVEIQEGQQVEFEKKGRLNVQFSGYDETVLYEWRKGNFAVSEEKSIEVTESDNYTVIVKLPDGRELGRQTAYVTIKHQLYTIQLGDNVNRIARKFYGDESGAVLIYKANPEIKEGDILKVGKQILVPNKTEFAKKEMLTIGTSDAFAPFAHPDGLNGGMITDMVTTIYKEMNQTVEVQYLSGRRIKGIYSGLTDLGFPFTKNRNDNLLYVYSDAVYTSLVVFFTNEKSKVNDVDETMKKRIRNEQYTKLSVAIPINFICDALLDYADKEYLLLKPYLTTAACFEAMKKGEVDLVAMPQIVGLVTIQNTPNLNRGEFKILPKSLETTSFHVVISKEHPEGEMIINDFNIALEKAKENGTIGQIIDTHIDLIQASKP